VFSGSLHEALLELSHSSIKRYMPSKSWYSNGAWRSNPRDWTSESRSPFECIVSYADGLDHELDMSSKSSHAMLVFDSVVGDEYRSCGVCCGLYPRIGDACGDVSEGANGKSSAISVPT
jgi:hypothetical protein